MSITLQQQPSVEKKLEEAAAKAVQERSETFRLMYGDPSFAGSSSTQAEDFKSVFAREIGVPKGYVSFEVDYASRAILVSVRNRENLDQQLTFRIAVNPRNSSVLPSMENFKAVGIGVQGVTTNVAVSVPLGDPKEYYSRGSATDTPGGKSGWGIFVPEWTTGGRRVRLEFSHPAASSTVAPDSKDSRIKEVVVGSPRMMKVDGREELRAPYRAWNQGGRVDEEGYILFDEQKLPTKFVVLREHERPVSGKELSITNSPEAIAKASGTGQTSGAGTTGTAALPAGPVSRAAAQEAGAAVAKQGTAILPLQKNNTVHFPVPTAQLVSLLTLGANGFTRTELLRASGQTDKPASFRDLLGSFDANQSIDFRVVAAGGMFVDAKFTIDGNFSGVAERELRARARNVDFDNPAEAAKAINSWSAEATKISPVVSEQDVQNGRLFLLASTTLQAKWVKPFDNTVSEDFFVAPDKRVPVAMMKDSSPRDVEEFTVGNRFGGIRIPYKGNGSLYVISGSNEADLDIMRVMWRRSFPPLEKRSSLSGFAGVPRTRMSGMIRRRSPTTFAMSRTVS